MTLEQLPLQSICHTLPTIHTRLLTAHNQSLHYAFMQTEMRPQVSCTLSGDQLRGLHIAPNNNSDIRVVPVIALKAEQMLLTGLYETSC